MITICVGIAKKLRELQLIFYGQVPLDVPFGAMLSSNTTNYLRKLNILSIGKCTLSLPLEKNYWTVWEILKAYFSELEALSFSCFAVPALLFEKWEAHPLIAFPKWLRTELLKKHLRF